MPPSIRILVLDRMPDGVVAGVDVLCGPPAGALMGDLPGLPDLPVLEEAELVAPAGVADSVEADASLRSAASAACCLLTWRLSESVVASDSTSMSSGPVMTAEERPGYLGGGAWRLGSSWAWALMTRVSSS